MKYYSVKNLSLTDSGRAALVRTRTMLVNAARRLTKSYGERLRGCNARGMKPELKSALEG